jgi:hypothetical protein
VRRSSGCGTADRCKVLLASNEVASPCWKWYPPRAHQYGNRTTEVSIAIRLLLGGVLLCIWMLWFGVSEDDRAQGHVRS